MLKFELVLTYNIQCSNNRQLKKFQIFVNAAILNGRRGCQTILKGTLPRPARFDLIWFSGFRGKDLNVKVYDIQRTSSDDGKSNR